MSMIDVTNRWPPVVTYKVSIYFLNVVANI